MSLRRFLLWGVCLGLLAWLGLKLIPSDERLIHKRLTALAEQVSIQPKESSLARLAKANRVVEFFTPEVTVEVEGLDVTVNDRNDLREALIAARGNLREAEVQFVDVHVRFPEEKRSAVAYATAVAHLDNETNAFARSLKMNLRKVERNWLISRVESIATGE